MHKSVAELSSVADAATQVAHRMLVAGGELFPFAIVVRPTGKVEMHHISTDSLEPEWLITSLILWRWAQAEVGKGAVNAIGLCREARQHNSATEAFTRFLQMEIESAALERDITESRGR